MDDRDIHALLTDAATQERTYRDTLERLAHLIARGTGGREVALAITKLDEASMWLDRAHGKVAP